jgi:DNA-binding IclR family transcriptional regulator
MPSRVYRGAEQAGQFVQPIAHWKPVTPTNSLERALLLLELVENTPGGLRNAEIGRQLNIPRSSCSWILTRLTHQGYLTCDEVTGRYKIGLKTVALARGALRELGFRASAEPVLYRLASQTGLAAGIGVWESGRVLIADRVEPPEASGVTAIDQRPRDQRDVGRELPAHTTALGKVLLAWLPRQEIASYLEEHVLTRRTSRTIVSRDALISELRRIRQRGYALADGEHDPELRALAAPIMDYTEQAHAALSLNGGATAPAWRKMRALVDVVTRAAAEISASTRFPYMRP